MAAPDVLGMLYRLLQSRGSGHPAPVDHQAAQTIAAQAAQAPQSRFDMEGEPASAPGPGLLPPGLPDAVMRSILTQPSYGEGQLIPFRRVVGQLPFDTQMNREFSLGNSSGNSSRTGGDRLYNELGDWRDFQKLDQPLPEGMRPYTDQFRGQPMYPSPLNQFMGRLPGMGLY